MKKRIFLLLFAALCFFSCKKERGNDLPDGLYADIETNKGLITVQLEFEKTPITVASFVSLAEGKNTFVNEQFKGKKFYDGLKWHRVIKEFMIQGGDPLGNGSGDTGYKFKDEIATDLHFDKGGVLAMANSGPGTNSSQFFITHVATPWLDGRHTIFGHVVGKGMDVVNKIEQNDDIMSVSIIRKGEKAKKFDAVKIFTDFFSHEAENQKKQALADAENKKIYDAKYKEVKDKKMAYFAALRNQAKEFKSGLALTITSKGKGKKPAAGDMQLINYSGFLESGELFDSSVADVAKAFGKYDQNREAQQGYTPIEFQAGAKRGMIPGFIEGLENMSYGDKAVLFIPSNIGFGAQGAGQVIPPNANLIFEVELVGKK